MVRSRRRALALVVLVSVSASALAQRKALAKLRPDAEALKVAVPPGGSWFEHVRLPGKGAVHGIACRNDELWLVRDQLYVMDAGDREVRRTLRAPEGLLGMAADDQFVYLLRADGIAVVDPRAGQEMRRIALPKGREQDPAAVGAFGAELFVVWADGMVGIDKRTGKVRECERPSFLPRWMASDGESLWTGASNAFCRVSTATLEERVQGEALLPQFAPALGTFVRGRLLLVHNPHAKAPVSASILAPQSAWSPEKLDIQLQRRDGKLEYVVGPKPIKSRKQFVAQIKRLSNNPAVKVPRLRGELVHMPVVFVVHLGVKVRDLTEAWDVVTAAGFDSVSAESFKGRRLPEAPPPPPPPERKDGK